MVNPFGPDSPDELRPTRTDEDRRGPTSPRHEKILIISSEVFAGLPFRANCMLNVWRRGWRRVIRLEGGDRPKFLWRLRVRKGGEAGEGGRGHMRHCAGFEFRLTASWGRRKPGRDAAKGLVEGWDRIGQELGLAAGNYQHDSRVMTLIVGAACDTREMEKS